MHAPEPTAGSRPWSLERRLPLLISALLVLALGVFGAVAYRVTRLAAVERAEDRLERAARELARTSVASSGPRLAQLRALAADPAIRRAAAGAGDPSADSAARARLAASSPAADSMLLGWQVWGVASERRLATGDSLAPGELALLGRTVAEVAATDSARRSPFFASGQRAGLWSVVPVHDGGRLVGFLAERRGIANNPRTEQTLRQLTGEDVAIMFTSRGASQWVAVTGRPIAPALEFPANTRDDTVALARDASGAAHFAVRAPVAGTPWYIVLAQPRDAVLRRPREFLVRLLGAGVLVLLAGALGAWLVSRHVTRPLRAITSAAEAIAAGDYARRVGGGEVRGAAELTRLASTFDTMATRVAEARADLEDRNAALERANAAKAQFLAMMSHELRTPLNAIGGYAELIELGVRGPVTPAQVEDVRRIRRNKEHLLAIINDLLSFARADAGRISLRLVAVPLGDVLHATVETVGSLFDEKGVLLRVEDAPPDVRVLADRDRTQQILLNLLTNAVRFTDAGGEVSITSQALEDEVRIHVHDTGIGIPPDRLESIFEPFVQVDAGLTRRVGGTGLGLAIARDLAKAMGGSLTVRSVEGEGSTFTVTLPRHVGSHEESRRAEPAGRVG